MDVEFSKHVEDESVAYIKRLKGLVKVNVFRTNLSMEGQVIEFEFSKCKSQILRSKNSFDPYPSQAFWIIDYELYITKFHLVHSSKKLLPESNLGVQVIALLKLCYLLKNHNLFLIFFFKQFILRFNNNLHLLFSKILTKLKYSAWIRN